MLAFDAHLRELRMNERSTFARRRNAVVINEVCMHDKQGNNAGC
jgi:hypothetical protein